MSIGIIQTRPGIGDFCVFLPFIHFISKYLNKKIIVITKQRTFGKELVKSDPYIDRVIYIDDKKNSFQLIKILKKEKFEKIFIFHFSFRYYLICLLSRIKNIYFYGFFKKKVDIVNFARLSLENWLDTKINRLSCEFFFNNNNNNKKKIILGIGGSGKNKKWSIKNFINLTQKLNLPDHQLVIAGGKDEIQDANKIMSYFPNNSFSLCDINFPETIKFIQGAKFYVGNDTGFMHVSGMLGIKSFGLFGDTPKNYSSYNNLIIPITPENKEDIGHGDLMMSQITVKKVLNTIKSQF